MTKDADRDSLVALAEEAVTEFVKCGKVKSMPEPLPPELTEKAGAFVCLKKYGELRGCIGTIQPTRENLALEIIQNAINAATEDPRFPQVSTRELDDLEVSVDVLGEAEPVNSEDELDPKIYGVVVESGYRRGVLLPDLEGIDTVDEQVNIAMRKAGIFPGEEINLYRFKVTRHV